MAKSPRCSNHSISDGKRTSQTCRPKPTSSRTMAFTQTLAATSISWKTSRRRHLSAYIGVWGCRSSTRAWTYEVFRQSALPAVFGRPPRHEADLHDSRPHLRLQFVLPHLLQLGAAPQKQRARTVVRGDSEDVRLARRSAVRGDERRRAVPATRSSGSLRDAGRAESRQADHHSDRCNFQRFDCEVDRADVAALSVDADRRESLDRSHWREARLDPRRAWE